MRSVIGAIVLILAVVGIMALTEEMGDSDLENAAEDVGDAIDDAADEIDAARAD